MIWLYGIVGLVFWCYLLYRNNLIDEYLVIRVATILILVLFCVILWPVMMFVRWMYKEADHGE